jgi:hypothetical protein
MFPEAAARYHELLANEDLAESSRALLDEGLEKAKLIFGGRRLSPYLRPHFVSQHDFERVCQICETVWSAIQKVKDAAVVNPAVEDDLGLTEIERELVAIDPGYAAVSPTARLDSFLTQSTYSFVELNAESPAGIAYADAAYDIFSSLPVMKEFAAEYNVLPMYGRGFLLDVLLTSYEEYLGRASERPPCIAIVDLADLPTVSEFELFREFFEESGHPSVICTPQQLEFRNNRLSFEGQQIDIVYKRLLVNEYVPIMREYPALLDAYRSGAVCMINSFRSKLIHKKALFGVLTNPKHAALFSDEELTAIRAHVPWTRMVRDERTDYFGRDVNLLDFIRADNERLVLKPNDDYGGRGITIGWSVDQRGWDDAINNALADGGYLVQERVPTAREIFPALTADGRIEFAEQLVDLDPLLFNGIVRSAFTRLSFSELANVSSGGGMVPTFIISKK